MAVVNDTRKRYISITLDLTNNCSWWLNDLALRYDINVFYRFLPFFGTYLRPPVVDYTETSE
jgi:hypothetical protein